MSRTTLRRSGVGRPQRGRSSLREGRLTVRKYGVQMNGIQMIDTREGR
jgi:hypothetical protein